MKLCDIKIYSYSLDFKKPVSIKNNQLDKRDGFIIKISDNDNNLGIGETAPLPNFSTETYEDARAELISFANEYQNKEIPSDILGRISSYSPSVRFGLESALLTLQASKKQLTLTELLNPTSIQLVKVNALLNGSDDEIISRVSDNQNKFESYKLKIGRRDIDSDLNLIDKINSHLNEKATLRLDANRMLDDKNADEFLKRLSGEKIEYIEEPFKSLDSLEEYFQKSPDPLPIALDESLINLTPDDLSRFPKLTAIILKPTLLGFTGAMAFAKKAKEMNIKAVVSSSFESTIGLYLLTSMAAVIDNGVPAGLDTADAFSESLTNNSLEIENGLVNLKTVSRLLESIDYQKLNGVSCD